MNTLNVINDKGEIRLSLNRQSQLQKICNVCVWRKRLRGKEMLYTIFLKVCLFSNFESCEIISALFVIWEFI